jgi:heterodisulfide reductase subunit A
MFTAKQVSLAKKAYPDPAGATGQGLDVTVFHMDLRAFGKDFEAYLDDVRALPGVTYRREMPSAVHQRQQNHNLVVTIANQDGRLQDEEFDLLVLATGFAPPRGMQALAQDLGLQLNEYGFPDSEPYHPTRSPLPGVFLAGACREPKDIPDTVAEATGAAADVAAFLQKETTNQQAARGAVSGQQRKREVRDLSDEQPSVGVFVCACNGELAPLCVPDVVSWAEQLPDVTLARQVNNGCSPDGLAEIRTTIEKEKPNRVVVAGCSHRLFNDAFGALMQDCQLDPRLLARVNLRDQVVFPQAGNDNGANLSAKAKSLVGMAVANLRSMAGLEALVHSDSRVLTRRAVVLGGGAAGMTAALELARLGIPVDLVEWDSQLGGQWQHIRYQADGSDPQSALRNLISLVQTEDRIRVRLGATLTALAGQPGQYRSTLADVTVDVDGREETIENGVLVVATGGHPATTNEYLYGQDPRVLTQRELELQIADGTLATAQSVVMIQCVGSREPHRPYCSRVCCTQAVKNALKLKELRPKLDVYILFREVRTYGFREAYYQAARDAGVVFVRFEVAEKPEVEAKADRLQVRLFEPITRQPLELNADLLVLSTGIDAEGEPELVETLGLVLNDHGFFAEEHPKMKPLDTAKGGIFLTGLAHSPRFLEETIAQAQGAAMRAAAYLAPEVLTERPSSVWVNERLCSFCGLCVEACPYQARVMNYDTRIADVDYSLCQGCGVCAMVCPNKATLQKAFEHRQLMATIDAALV